jgi:drug/metabolite transporter (DMT)-like permease
MSVNIQKNLRGMALAAAGFSFYSIGDVFIKYAGAHYPPEQVALFINLFFLPLLLTVSSKVGGLKATLKTKHLKFHLMRSGLGMVTFFSVMNGFQTLGMATSYTLLFAAPFILTILSIFFLKQQIGVYRWASIAAGFIGVLVVLRPGMVPLEPAALMILLGAFCYSCSTIIIRKIGEDEPLMAFSLYGAICGTIVFGSMMLIKGSFIMPEPSHLWFFFGTAFFHIFAGFWVNRAFSSAETSLIAPFQYIQLLWGVAFGFFLFNTPIDLWTGVGGAIIVGSGLYMIHRERVRHREINIGVVTHMDSLVTEVQAEKVIEDRV